MKIVTREFQLRSPASTAQKVSRPSGALSDNNNRGVLPVPSDFHMEER
jgi:hypothetical protein